MSCEAASIIASCCLLITLAVTAFFTRSLAQLRVFEKCDCFQVTICSWYVGPIVALRLAAGFFDADWAGLPLSLFWVLALVALGLRCQSVWAVALLVLEVASGFVLLTPRFCTALLLLQPIIILVFWAAMLAVTFLANDALSFLPLDRHLRKGAVHIWKQWEPKSLLLRELAGHSLAQSSLAVVLYVFAPRPLTLTWAAFWDLGMALGAWLLYAVILGCALAPHRLPYEIQLPISSRQPPGPTQVAPEGSSSPYQTCDE